MRANIISKHKEQVEWQKWTHIALLLFIDLHCMKMRDSVLVECHRLCFFGSWCCQNATFHWKVLWTIFHQTQYSPFALPPSLPLSLFCVFKMNYTHILSLCIRCESVFLIVIFFTRWNISRSEGPNDIKSIFQTFSNFVEIFGRILALLL